MFCSTTYFDEWCESHSLPFEARSIIHRVRSNEPSRRVRSGTRNVSGRYPSRKMGRTIQFESHRNELATILELEHDPNVIEYYDQPPQIKLDYHSEKGKHLGVLHTSDFFVIRTDGAFWLECKTEDDLKKLAQRQPTRYLKDSNKWRCPPGEDYASQFGLSYALKSSAEIDWTFQRNVTFLEDYLRADELEIPNEVVTYIQSLVLAQPGVTLSSILQQISVFGIAADHIYTLIVTDQLFVDLSAFPLSKPEKVQLFLDRQSFKLYETVLRPSNLPTNPALVIKAGAIVNWDNQSWEVLNRGDSETWLRNQDGTIVTLENNNLESLASLGKFEPINVSSFNDEDARQTILTKILSANPADLEEATRRYRLLQYYLSRKNAEEAGVTLRTLQRWKAQYLKAESLYGSGFIGLLSRKQSRGNRQRKLPAETIEMIDEIITNDFENVRQPSRYSVWSKLTVRCEEKGLIVPSYRTFCKLVRLRPQLEKTVKRKGKRASYSLEPFYFELEMKTPRHGERPFEICHIDHTELDVELVCSFTGQNLGRPWLTLLVDAYSRRVLALYLTFDPPSYRSCMMILREVVCRYNRLPQTIVIDGGLEFSGVYFETLLACYECTQKIRPASKSRFGSVIERLFGTTNTRFVYNLIGNTQLTKDNVRYITKEVAPKNLAAWTLETLHERLCDFLFEIYDTIEHPALGQSPREAFLAARARSGQRELRYIPYKEEFQMLTMPTTLRGTARVQPGRGVKINHIYYWSDGFRDGAIEGTNVPVRYDPFNVGKAFAFMQNQWFTLISDHYLTFSECTERELMLASNELRRRNQQHSRRFTITARKLAEFLESVQVQEAELIQQQRRRDRAVRRLRNNNGERVIPERRMRENQSADTLNQATAILSDNSVLYMPHAAGAVSSEREGDPDYSLFVDEELDVSQLEIYGEYH